MPVANLPASRSIPRAQAITEKALAAVERFSHIEALSGIVLIIAAVVALVWANVDAPISYDSFWHAEVAVSIGAVSIGQSLHFLVNDGLMTVFFLIVGMEIRQEIHDGALSSLKTAALPIGAAVGGVLVPAGIYLLLNSSPATSHGWAVPTATDIAFAVGVLALLGKSIPANIRVFLLALAIIDDIVAILIIAIFYTTGLDYQGAIIALIGCAAVFAMQRMGVGNAWIYVIPGAVIWVGLFKFGVHPTLAGVFLGLITPVRSIPSRETPIDLLSNAFRDLTDRSPAEPKGLAEPLKQIRFAEREVVPPVQRVQQRLHPWVAFGIMPLFALANAGVNFGGIELAEPSVISVVYGVTLALIFGKPIGVFVTSYSLVRLGICQLPEHVSWKGIMLIGLLAGIGFTMSIFIAALAFQDESHLSAAKLSVLCASTVAAVIGLLWGVINFKGQSAPPK